MLEGHERGRRRRSDGARPCGGSKRGEPFPSGPKQRTLSTTKLATSQKARHTSSLHSSTTGALSHTGAHRLPRSPQLSLARGVSLEGGVSRLQFHSAAYSSFPRLCALLRVHRVPRSLIMSNTLSSHHSLSLRGTSAPLKRARQAPTPAHPARSACTSSGCMSTLGVVHTASGRHGGDSFLGPPHFSQARGARNMLYARQHRRHATATSMDRDRRRISRTGDAAGDF